nr:uncharacterized protein LOC114827151 [Malus domestica]
MANLSIDTAAKHKVLSFMDGNAGYNKIKMAKEDIHKTAFKCPGHVGAYEYLVMPFGLKNVGATYQIATNAIFHDLIGHSMEVYIDDIVVKSKTGEQHLVDLRQALTRMRIHKLKMNPKKCAFEAEYEALIIGLGILIELGATEVKMFGDSELGIEISTNHIPRASNTIANEMAQLVSGAQIQEKKFERDIEVNKRHIPSIFERGFSLDVMTEEIEIEDWRTPIVQYLKDSSFPTSKKNTQQATKYVLWNGNLLRKTQMDFCLNV